MPREGRRPGPPQRTAADSQASREHPPTPVDSLHLAKQATLQTREVKHKPSGTANMAAALLDRLLHRSVVLDIIGDSYRLRDHHARTQTLRAAAHHGS